MQPNHYHLSTVSIRDLSVVGLFLWCCSIVDASYSGLALTAAADDATADATDTTTHANKVVII